MSALERNKNTKKRQKEHEITFGSENATFRRTFHYRTHIFDHKPNFFVLFIHAIVRGV
jgi:hypothetical protein